MRLIKEFANFRKPTYSTIRLLIKGQSPIVFDEKKTEEKDILIRSLINKLYPGFTADSSYNINGYIVSGELINKSQKNISILYEIVDIAKSMKYPTNTADDIINFIREYGRELLHPEGRFFERIITRLGSATTKGKKIESESNDIFKRYAKSKGINVDIKDPEDYRQDIAGVDAWFEYGGKKYTIQTKTLREIVELENSYIIHISGDFTKIKTNYLILISPEGPSYIFKGKNVQIMADIDNLDYYTVPKIDLLYKES